MKHPEGIKSLIANRPIGAHVTLGRKMPGGGVTGKDQFHFVSPFEGADKTKPYLPQFNEYHRLKPEFRRMIKANLIYGHVQQSFTHRLRMIEFPKNWAAPRARPKHIPVCEGNGEIAFRWQQKGSETTQIRCPDKLCEFRTCEPALCKPFTEFIFRPRWEGMDLPSPVCLMRSPTAWSSAANIAGFFKDLQDMANEPGINMPDATFFGFPFTIQLVQMTNPVKRQKWWAIVLTPDEDIVTFLRWQREAIRQLQEPLRVEAIPDLRDRPDDGEVYEDIQSVEVGK